MSTVLHPVGPNPPRVYWVRRLVVLVALVVVVAGLIALIWAVGFRDGGGEATEANAATGAAADQAATDGAVAPAVPVDCLAANLQLTVVSDATQYASGVNPVLQAAVTNVGADACTVDAGNVAREVVITSGADRIWSTKDCASAENASRQLLLSGAGGRDAVDIAWDRIRSGEGCPADLPAPRAGTYQAVVTLLGMTAEPAVFALQ